MVLYGEREQLRKAFRYEELQELIKVSAAVTQARSRGKLSPDNIMTPDVWKSRVLVPSSRARFSGGNLK